jgi:hypothetical protein
MAKATKIKLDTLYEVRAASEATPQFYTVPTIEIYAAEAAVTIRATTNPDYDQGYADLPVVTSSAVAGDVYQTDAARAVKFVSFSSSDSDAEVYVSGFILTEKPEPEDDNEGE